MSMKKFKVGDVVTIAPGTMPVKRVGYRLHHEDEAAKECRGDHALKAWLAAMPKDGVSRNQIYRIEREVARMYVDRKGFGGSTREVIRYTVEEMITGEYPLSKPSEIQEDEPYRIIDKKIRFTGKYEAGGYRTNWNGGDDYEPACIEDRKAVHVLTVKRIGSGIFGDSFDVVAEDCEPAEVKRATVVDLIATFSPAFGSTQGVA